MKYKTTIGRQGTGRCLAQLVSMVRERLVAGLTLNTAIHEDPLWSDTEIKTELDNAVMAVWKIVKVLRQSFFFETASSLDGIVGIGGEQYNFSNLQMQADKVSYLLPPDFSEMKNVRAVTVGYEATRFTYRSSASPDFRAALYHTGSNGIDEYFFDIVGRRNLILAPKPVATVDLEIDYIRRPLQAVFYKDGTAVLTNGSADVTGSSTLWTLIAGYVSNPGLALAGALADPNVIYPIVATIPTDTSLTLVSNYTGVTEDPANYSLSSISEFDREVDEILVSYTLSRLWLKGASPNVYKSREWEGHFRNLMADYKDSISQRDLDPQYVEAYLEDQ